VVREQEQEEESKDFRETTLSMEKGEATEEEAIPWAG
jgi:hypothetical protein